MFPGPQLGCEVITAPVEAFVASCAALVVLHDGCVSLEFLSRISALSPSAPAVTDARQSELSCIDGLPTGAGILYVCLQDDLGLPFIERAYARKLPVHPVHFVTPRSYVFRNHVAKRTLAEEVASQRAQGYLKLDGGPGDFINLIQAFEATRNRPGCIVEVGCFRGSSGGALLSYARARQEERGFPEQSFYFLDVFGGFDYTEAKASSDVFWQGTHATEGLEVVRRRLQAYGEGVRGLDIHVERCNVITDAIPPGVSQSGVRLANIDVDLYEATVAGLTRFAPLIVPGGIMICEDAGHTPLLIGALKAVEEFMATDAGRHFCRIDMPSGQAFLVRATA